MSLARDITIHAEVLAAKLATANNEVARVRVFFEIVDMPDRCKREATIAALVCDLMSNGRAYEIARLMAFLCDARTQTAFRLAISEPEGSPN